MRYLIKKDLMNSNVFSGITFVVLFILLVILSMFKLEDFLPIILFLIILVAPLTYFMNILNYTDEDFYKKHPIIYLNTPGEGNVEYEIFSFYLTGNYRSTYGETYTYQFADDQAYQEYLNMITSQSQYDTGVEVSVDDSIITLSTCTNRTDDERYIVHAKKIS